MSERPGRFRPYGLVRDFKENASSGGLTFAVKEAFRAVNVRISTKGETESISDKTKGILFLGDHQQGGEHVILAGVLGEKNRDDLHFLGLPYAPTGYLAKFLNVQLDKYLLPVIPGRLARTLLGRRYSEIKKKNNESLTKAGELLATHNTVVIFPTARTNPITSEWRQGAARILANVPAEKRAEILVMPFRCDEYSKIELGLAAAGKTVDIKTPKAREIIINFGKEKHKSVYDLIGEEKDTTKITQILKKYYTEQLKRVL